MLIEKGKDWFVFCDGEKCKNSLPFHYVNKVSAMADIIEYGWKLRNAEMCYCPKCTKKISN